MRTAERLEQGGLPTSRQLARDGLGNEPTPVAFEPVDVIDEFGGQRDGDACGVGHGSNGMTHDMVTLIRPVVLVSGNSGTKTT